MNDTTIEKLLFHAPRPTPSAGLLQRLQADITLPSKERPATNGSRENPLRRWLPALAFGLFLLTCVIVAGMQASWVRALKQTNVSLRAAAPDLDQLRQEHAANETLRLRLDELNRLRKDHEELLQLRAEAAQLRTLAQETMRLRADNQRLAASLTAAGSQTDEQFFAEAKAREERVACVNNLKQVSLSIKVWAGDYHDRTPTSFVAMSNELNTAKILVCPGDKAKLQFASLGWDQFQDSMSSYELRTTGGVDDVFPQSILLKCPIHHNFGLADGSVQSADPDKYREVTVEGRTYLRSIAAPRP